MPERKKNRLPDYDYSQEGYYFVTICVKNKKNVFGIIENNEMKMNEYGMTAMKCWADIPVHYKNCELDEFIIMPNHIHGIIIIDFESESKMETEPISKQASFVPTPVPVTVPVPVGNRHACSLRVRVRLRVQRPYQQIPIIIGSYKSAVSKLIHRTGLLEFQWQKSYYDRIIRDDDELDRIREYIRNNPVNWNDDEENNDE